jgi:hypothetical protein
VLGLRLLMFQNDFEQTLKSFPRHLSGAVLPIFEVRFRGVENLAEVFSLKNRKTRFN